MKQPEDFLADGQEHLVILTQKEQIYSHPDALDAQLKLMELKQSTNDTCIYTSTTESDGLFILAVYVHDILLEEKSQRKIAQVKADLRKQIQFKDMGELHYFLGVNVYTAMHMDWLTSIYPS